MEQETPGDEATSKVQKAGRQPVSKAREGSIPSPGPREPTGWEICPLKGKPHADHDAAIRKLTERLAASMNHVARLERSLDAAMKPQVVVDNGGLEERVKILEATLKENPSRTARILAERLFEVEAQNAKLREVIGEKERRR